MLVLHALWEMNRGLHLWAESGALLSETGAGRKKKGQNPAHPFALSSASLAETAAGLVSGQDIKSTQAGSLTILLPSSAGRPLPSPECPGPGTGDAILAGKKVELAPWQIATLTPEPGTALKYLSALESPPPGLVFGSDLRFWVEASKLALELLARECFVPSVRESEEDSVRRLMAEWEPVVENRDSERVDILASTMPAACRAIRSEGQPGPSPRSLIDNFLKISMDGFIRRSLEDANRETTKLKPFRSNSIAGQWLKALSSTAGQVKTTSKNQAGFVHDISAWLSQLKQASADTPLRTSFRLEPPAEDKQDWCITYHLQSSKDQSLLIPAEEVWKTRSGVITFLKQRFENPQERLLEDLGKASRIFSPIEDSLNTACPMSLNLDTGGAYQFLRQDALLLEQSGFGVLLPPWWQKPALRLGARLKIKPKTGSSGAGRGLLGLEGIVAYQWEIALGDNILSQKEFEKLASLKVPLVRVRGQWVELKPEEMEKALAFFKKGREGEMKLGEALRAGLGQEITETGLPVVDVSAEGWIKELMNAFSGDASRLPSVKPPAALKGELRPYQLTGVSWMAFLHQYGLGACLADDMGLGKTVEFISLLLFFKENRLIKGPSLLVCPMSVVNNWKREVVRFAPSLRVLVHHGADRDSAATLARKVKNQDIVVTTYSLVNRDAGSLSKIDWECLALDEAQNIKNPEAKQTRAVRQLNSRCRVALTGTPVENRLSELWSIMEFLNPGFLKSAQDFQTRFGVPIEKHHNPVQTERLKRLIQPFVLRRLKSDKSIIADLPEKIETRVFCNLTAEQATLYAAVVKEMLEKIEKSEGMERKGLVLATLLKLKQVCNHPAQFLQDRSTLPGRSGKLSRLEEMLEEILAEGDKALIFTQFAEMGRMLSQHLQESLSREVLFLYGGTPRKDRDVLIQRFQSEGRGPALFVLSLKAGGVGLNLTAANHVFHFDRWWNPAVENQATDRVFRIGQKKNVQVHKFVCAGTLEERIDAMIEQKKELAGNIISSGEAWLTEMSTAQLRETLALSREAMEG